MTLTPRAGFVLGLHPTSRGLSWILFDQPHSPHDWGNKVPRGPDKNTKCLEHIEKLVARFEPETIVLEAFEKRHSARADRIARLGRAITALAAERNIDVAIYTRGEVKACFAKVGAVSRHEIAEAVARHVPMLRHRLPRPRKSWQTEPPRMGLFSAAALVLTHYQSEAWKFLDDLSSEQSSF